MPEVKKTRDNNKMASKSSNCNDHGCLPLELITDILLRLPVKSLGRFKSVCKSWNSLISTHNFAKSHFQISASGSNTLAMPSLLVWGQGPCFLFPINLNDYCVDASREVRSIGPLNLGHCFSEHTEGPPLGSCHGLICSYVYSYTLHVVNPTTKQCRIIPEPKTNGEYAVIATGFGFVPSNDDYKIAKLMGAFGSGILHSVDRVDVFSFRDDQWRTLDISSTNLHSSLAGSCIYCGGSGAVWLNEALYWVVSMLPLGPPGGVFILEFDLAKERFSRASDIKQIGNGDLRMIKYYEGASLGVIAHNCLCVGQLYEMQSGERFLELWMMEEYGQLNTLFRFQLDHQVVPGCPVLNPFGFTTDGNVWLLVIDPVRTKHTRIFLVDPRRDPPTYVLVAEEVVSCAMTYSPSLVSPFHVGKAEQ